MSFSPGTPEWTREQHQWELERRREEKKKDLADIDGEILWGYGELRKIENFIEEIIERGAFTDKEAKRLDKAAVVMRTGFKMLKKVIKSRSPHSETSAWRDGVHLQ
jgi:hypothetical protein